MKSFQEIYTELQDTTGDDTDTRLTIFKRHINDTESLVLADHSWKFLEKTDTITTAADTDRYTLKADLRKLINVTTTPDNGTTIYRPRPVDDPNYWEYLQSLNINSSDITQYYYQEGNDLLIWPKYSSASKTITVRYRKNVIEMSRDDYTTGTIAAATNGSTTITGNSPSWNGRKPVGEQWIRIAQTTGDYRWYRLDAIASDTSLTLEKGYLGDTFSGQTLSYTLGEFPSMPGPYHNILVHRPLALYYMSVENVTMSQFHWRAYDGGFEIGEARRPGGLLRKMIVEQAGMLDAKYYPSQRVSEPISPEDLARESTSVFG